MAREHPLERRARLLAQRLKYTVDTTSNEINPPNKRPPLHNQVSPRAALAWWEAHRYDDLGKQWLQKVGATPAQVTQLDAWLTHAMQATHPELQPNAGPVGPAAPAAPVKPQQPPNMESFIIRRAFSREQAAEGPEIGSEVA